MHRTVGPDVCWQPVAAPRNMAHASAQKRAFPSAAMTASMRERDWPFMVALSSYRILPVQLLRLIESHLPAPLASSPGCDGSPDSQWWVERQFRGADIPVCLGLGLNPTWCGHSCLPWALAQPDVWRPFLSAEGPRQTGMSAPRKGGTLKSKEHARRVLYEVHRSSLLSPA